MILTKDIQGTPMPEKSKTRLPKLLQVVQFVVPHETEPLLGEYAAAQELDCSTWRLPEADMVTVRVYCHTRRAAELCRRQLRRELPTWFEGIAGAAEGLEQAEIVALPREDWSESWKQYFHAFRASPRLIVKPSWEPYASQAGDIVLELDPGMSFGTGYHGTTKACLQLIDEFSAGREGQSFLDAGCGSGILALAAWKLGLRPVVAFDNDPSAVAIAAENLQRNNAAGVSTFTGDLALWTPPQLFTFVAANILAPVLIAHATQVAGFLAPGPSSCLILSGILEAQYPEVKACYEKLGFRERAFRLIEGWASGCFSRA